MTPRERYRRARMAGASCSLDQSAWSKIVDKAVEIGEEQGAMLRIADPEAPPRIEARRPYEILPRDRVGVPAQVILDFEARLAEMEMEVAAIRELAESHEVAQALRERLRSRIEEVRDKLCARTAAEEIKN